MAFPFSSYCTPETKLSWEWQWGALHIKRNGSGLEAATRSIFFTVSLPAEMSSLWVLNRMSLLGGGGDRPRGGILRPVLPRLPLTEARKNKQAKIFLLLFFFKSSKKKWIRV